LPFPDIRHEAEAFAAFVADAVRGYGLDAAELVFLGYSNGANLLGAVMRLHPGLIHRAILLRGTEVLDGPPKADLADTRILLVSGAVDPFAAATPALIASLRQSGADLDERVIQAGHELADADAEIARGWLGLAG
jgi:phospholipase/carboxylesterase